MSEEVVSPWENEKFHPDGSINVQNEMGPFFEAWNSEGPMLQDRPAKGMPYYRGQVLEPLNEDRVRNGKPELSNHTQGDRGAANNNGQIIPLSDEFNERRAAVLEELLDEVDHGRYVGQKFTPRVRQAVAKFWRVEQDSFAMAIANSGRDVIGPWFRAGQEFMGLNPNETVFGTGQLDWNGYPGALLKGGGYIHFKNPATLRVHMGPEGVATAKTLEEAVKFALDDDRVLNFAGFATASPGNPGPTYTHKQLLELAETCGEMGRPFLLDGVYWFVSDVPAFNWTKLVDDMTPAARAVSGMHFGTTKFWRSFGRNGVIVSAAPDGLMADIVRSTAAVTGAGQSNFEPENISGLLTVLEGSRNMPKVLGEFGQHMSRVRGRLAQVMDEYSIPGLLSGGFYAFLQLNPGLLEMRQHFDQTGLAYIPDEVHLATKESYGFGRVSMANSDAALDTLFEAIYNGKL